jgi:hypothetical protein
MIQIQKIIPGTKMIPPSFNSHLNHPVPLPLTKCIPPTLQYKTRRWGPPFWVLFPFPVWGTRNVSLFFFPPTLPHCSHSRDNLLSVCWKCIPFLINFTVTFFFPSVLALELRAFTLSYSTSPFLWRIFVEIGSRELYYMPGLVSNNDSPDLCLLNS